MVKRMNFNFKKIKKATLLAMVTCSSQLSAITSNMSHRVMGTSPVLYRMMDYSKHQACLEVEPIFSRMYESSHVNNNIIIDSKNSLIFDQQGGGDINPTWLNLMSNNINADYKSTVTFTPNLSQSGALFHWYDQFDNNLFFDVKTALVQCKTEIEINEVGGGNGLIPGIINAQQAFTQSDWNYGKIGQANHVVGLDNIELRLGKVARCTSHASSYDMFVAGFAIIEAPTGSGTKAEWLFEPQVGTNHWGLGFGFEALVSGDDDLKFMVAGNYRYLIPSWETRSFDLLGNGQWSRYLSVQDTYGLPTAPATLGLPGINFFTQQAYINGRSELNIYTRLQKEFKSSYFEVSYNFLCVQQETIGAIKAVTPGYGVYALTGPAGGPGGVTTASTAHINQDIPSLDPLGSPVAVTTDRFDKKSACAGTYASNTLAARLEIQNKNIIYGFGASIESALSAAAISTWSVWAQFGFLFDSVQSSDCDHEFSPELFNFDAATGESMHHVVTMNDAHLPQDVIAAIEDEFLHEKDNFEFLDEDDFSMNEDIDSLQKSLIASEILQLKERLLFQEEEKNKEIDALQEIIKENLEEKEKMTLDTTPIDSSINNNDEDTDLTPAENIAATSAESSQDETAKESEEQDQIESSIKVETESIADTNQVSIQDNLIPITNISDNEISKPTSENTSESLKTEITEHNTTETESTVEPALQTNIEPVIQAEDKQNILPIKTETSVDEAKVNDNAGEDIQQISAATEQSNADQQTTEENLQLSLKKKTAPLSEAEILEKLDSKK